MMQQVITEKQARQITGGRKPLVPVVYETAVKALSECLTLDDAKQWDNKADALAAWAKIYRDGEVERKARALKLLAYKRMGDLAREIRGDGNRFSAGLQGNMPGSRALLFENGLTHSQADAAIKLSKIGPAEVEKFAEMKRPPAPISASRNLNRRGSDAWLTFNGPNGAGTHASCIMRTDPKSISTNMAADEMKKAAEKITKLAEWCDDALRHLERNLG